MLEYKFIKPTLKNSMLSILSGVIVNMIVIFITLKIFKNIYIENSFYLFIASLLLYMFNKIIKPFLYIIMLPLNIITLGFTYPIVNVVILKLIDWIMGTYFVLNGLFSVFFMSIFISIMTFIIDRLIGKEIRRV